MAIIVKGGGGKPEEEKTVTAGTSVIEVLPSSGKVMKKVTINPTPTETKEVSPTATDQTYNPPEGKHFSQFTVKGDSDLTAENIKEGVNIFGVDGSFDNSNGLYVWNKFQYRNNSKGNWVNYVVSDNNSEYPNGAAHTDGYWYELSDTANLTVATGTVYSTSSIDLAVQLGKTPKYFGISSFKAKIGTTSSGNLYSYNCYVSISESGTYLNVSFDSEGYMGYEIKSIQFTWFAIG